MLRVDLPGTLIFDYPTITVMSAMLTAKLGPKDAEPRAEAPSRLGPCKVSLSLCCLLLSGATHQGCHVILPQRTCTVQAKLKPAAERGRQLSASNRGARDIQQAAMSAPAMQAHGRHQLHIA